MNKQDIKDWLKGQMNFTQKGNGIVNIDQLTALVEQCFNELAPKWVSVEDELPEDGEEILMFMGDGAVMSDLRHHTGRFSAKYGFERSRVTHWMPLPKTNKLEGGE